MSTTVEFITTLYGPQWDQKTRRYENYDVPASLDFSFIPILDKWINDFHTEVGHKVISLQFVPRGIDQEQGYLLVTENSTVGETYGSNQ